jgi:hypothetical protein
MKISQPTQAAAKSPRRTITRKRHPALDRLFFLLFDVRLAIPMLLTLH